MAAKAPSSSPSRSPSPSHLPSILLLATGLLSLLLGGCGADTGSRAMAHVRKMVGFGPRPAGSEALKKTAAYIGAEIQKLGLKVKKDSWTEDEIEFTNLWTEIPGQDPDKGPILLLAAHYDTKLCAGHEDPAHNFRFVGAIDGGGASGLLLELARKLKERKNLPNIWLAWFDGEESVPYDWVGGKDTKQALYGSRRFAKMMDSRLKVMVLLDLIGSNNQKIDRDTESHKELLDLFGRAAEKIGESKRMYAHPSPMTDDHIPFKNLGGVRVIDLIDFHFRQPGGATHPDYKAWWHTPDDTLEQMDPDSLTFVGSLVWAALPMIEEKFYRD